LWRCGLICAAWLAAGHGVRAAAPGARDDAAAGYQPGDFWVAGHQVYQDSATGWRPFPLPSPYPVDAAGGGPPVACYGTRRLRAAYAGPLLRVVNPRTQAAADIFATSGGALNLGALRAAMAGADHAQVETIYDQCGHNDATQPSPANRPDIAPAVRMGSGVAVAFDGVSVTTPVAKYVLLPSTLAWARGTPSAQVAVLDVRAWYGESIGIARLRNPQDIPRRSLSWGYAAGARFFVFLTPHSRAALNPPASPRAPDTSFIAGYAASGRDVRLWMDRFSTTAPALDNPAVTGGAIGQFGPYMTYGYFDLGALLIYGRALSPAEQARATAAAALSFGLTPQQRDTIEVVGDSISEGYGSRLNLSWPRQMMKLLRHPYVMSNASLCGVTALDARPVFDTAFFRRGFLNGGGRRIVLLNLGSNDLAGGAQAADIYKALAGMVAAAHGAGAKVILGTVLPRQGLQWFGASYGADEKQRLALNALIRANAAGADGVIDFASDPAMGAYRNLTNGRYYFDGTHPSVSGDALLAADAAAVLNRLYGGAESGVSRPPARG
jgi:lysophospholipase L1-like esterase